MPAAVFEVVFIVAKRVVAVEFIRASEKFYVEAFDRADVFAKVHDADVEIVVADDRIGVAGKPIPVIA